jgi:hypothetical protein
MFRRRGDFFIEAAAFWAIDKHGLVAEHLDRHLID